jgi:hypothetical protein
MSNEFKPSWRDTILGTKIRTSLRFGSVLLPIGEAQQYLSRHAQPLVVNSSYVGYPFFLRGSGSCVKIRGCNLVIATAHQLYCSFSSTKINPNDVGLLVSNSDNKKGSTLITSCGFSHYNTKTKLIDTHAYDVCLFDFSTPAQKIPEIDHYFFNDGNDLDFDDFENALGFLGYGYRFEDQSLPDSDLETANFRVRMYAMEFEKRTNDDALVALCSVGAGASQHNGISGGPVFAVVDSGSFLTVRFAGVICLASNGTFHVIRAGSIAKMVRLFGSLDYSTD